MNSIQTLSSRLFQFLSGGLLCISIGACSPIREGAVDHSHWLTWHPALKDALQKNAAFEFEVIPQQQGRYQVTGETELPDGSRLAIAAIRYLKLDPDFLKRLPTEQTFSATSTSDTQTTESKISNFLEEPLALKSEQLSSIPSEAIGIQNPTLKRLALDPSYTILDYEQVDVQNGEWQIELNLWQVAKDGQYQESWQLHQEKLEIRWQAEPDVIFLVTLVVDGAADRLQPIQDELAEKNLTLSSTLIHTSLEGEQYFQSAQPLSIDLPDGSTTPPGLRVQEINGGWGERYLLVEQDPLPGTLKFPTKRNSDAPGSPREFIQ